MRKGEDKKKSEINNAKESHSFSFLFVLLFTIAMAHACFMSRSPTGSTFAVVEYPGTNRKTATIIISPSVALPFIAGTKTTCCTI